MKAIEAAIERLSKCHPEHISQYGTGNEERLTGACPLLRIACRLGGGAGCRQHSCSLAALLGAPPGLPAPHPSTPGSLIVPSSLPNALPPQASTRRATSTPSASAWPTAARPSASRCRCSWRARCAAGPGRLLLSRAAGGLECVLEGCCWRLTRCASGIKQPSRPPPRLTPTITEPFWFHLTAAPLLQGYLEDRRPAANVDPYTVVRLLIKNTSEWLAGGGAPAARAVCHHVCLPLLQGRTQRPHGSLPCPYLPIPLPLSFASAVL